MAQTFDNGGFEGSEVGVVPGVQALFLDELPQPLNQVEIRRVGRQETQFDVQAGRGCPHQGTVLIAGIVQENADGLLLVQRRQPAQEFADRLGSKYSRRVFSDTPASLAIRACGNS